MTNISLFLSSLKGFSHHNCFKKMFLNKLPEKKKNAYHFQPQKIDTTLTVEVKMQVNQRRSDVQILNWKRIFV